MRELYLLSKVLKVAFLSAMLTGCAFFISSFSNPTPANAQSGLLGTIYTANPGLNYCVISIPVAGTDVPWIVSGYNDGGFSMVVAMTNVCTLPGNPIQCRAANNGALNASGTAWNHTAGATTNNNRCAQGPGGRCAYMTQMDNVFANLPAMIDGIPRETLVRNTMWDMDGFAWTTGARNDGFNAPVQSRVNLPSQFDWLVGHDTGTGNSVGQTTNCANNSLGQRFTQARFGHTNCVTQNINTAPATRPPTATGYNHPWMRSAGSDGTGDTWLVTTSATVSLSRRNSNGTYGLLPAIWISSDLPISCGTFSSPGDVGGLDCSLPANANNLECREGEIVNIPVGGFDVPWLISDFTEGGYTMAMAMVNLCRLHGNPIACTSTAVPSTGTMWSSTGSNTNPTYFTQMNNVFTSLPATIGGSPRNDAVRNTAWDMDGFNTSGVRSDNMNAPVTMRVNLPSHFEWQSGRDTGTGNSITRTLPCEPYSLGYLFTQARFGHNNCLTQNINANNSFYNSPWLRSAFSFNATDSWVATTVTSHSLDWGSTGSATSGLLPAIWISSDLNLPTRTLESFAPEISLTNSSIGWFSTPRNSVITTIGGAGGIHQIRYSWSTNAMNDLCTTGGTTRTSGQATSNAPPGGSTLFVCAVDNTGLVTTATGTFNVETTAPTITVSGASDNWANTARTSSATITDTGGSGLAGARRVELPAGSDSPFTSLTTCQTAGDAYTSGATVNTAQGDRVIFFCAWDNAGNWRTVSGTYRWENTPPTCGTTWNPAEPVAWKSTAATQLFTLTGNSDTGGSGLAAASVNISCTAAATHNAACPVTISDNAGNTAVCTSPANRIDTTSPVIEITNHSADWYNTNLSSTITATDALSGLAEIRWAWSTDGVSPLNSGCTNGTQITSGGSTDNVPAGGRTLHVCARDNAGNVAAKAGTFRVDITPPTCGSFDPSEGPWHNDTDSGTFFSLVGYGDLGGSGLAAGNVFNCTTGTNHGDTCTINLTDNAGNTTPCTSPINRVSTIAPSCGDWQPEEGAWHNNGNTGTTFTLAGYSDNSGSGLAAGDRFCTTGTNFGDTCSITISDNAGNSSTCTSPINRVDTQPPVCGTWQPEQSPWQNTGAGVTFTLVGSADAGYSGLSSSNVFECTTGENHGDTCTITLSDNVGNTTPCISPANQIDDAAPVINVHNTSTVWSNTQATASATVTDNGGSGLAGIRYIEVDYSNPNPFATIYYCQTVGSEYVSDSEINTSMGNMAVYFCAYDNAGNFFTAGGNYRWENLSPAVTVYGSSSAWLNTQPQARANATDMGGSGLADVRHTFADSNPFSTPFDCETVGLTYDNNTDFATPIGGITSWWCALDNAGNFTVAYGVYNYDPTPPHASIIYNASPAPEVIDSSNPNYNLLVSDSIAAFDSQINIDLNADGGDDTFTINTINFDPLHTDLSAAGSTGQVSGVASCQLEMRMVNILTDGSGHLSTTFDGDTEVIDWTNFAVVSSDCTDTFDFRPEPNTAYHFRYTTTDNAGNSSDAYVSSTLIYNLSVVYDIFFNSLDDERSLVSLNCTDTPAGSVCGAFGTVAATLGRAAGNFTSCLEINGASEPFCVNVTANPNYAAPYDFTINAGAFPFDRDTFIGGVLTTISPEGATFSRNVNIVVHIRRNVSGPQAPVFRQNYVRMFYPALND